jgi:hypothetical protein
MKRDVVECEDDGQPAVISRFHAVMGGNDLSYIRDWLDETNYPYELFQRVLIDHGWNSHQGRYRCAVYA